MTGARPGVAESCCAHMGKVGKDVTLVAFFCRNRTGTAVRSGDQFRGGVAFCEM